MLHSKIVRFLSFALMLLLATCKTVRDNQGSSLEKFDRSNTLDQVKRRSTICQSLTLSEIDDLSVKKEKVLGIFPWDNKKDKENHETWLNLFYKKTLAIAIENLSLNLALATGMKDSDGSIFDLDSEFMRQLAREAPSCHKAMKTCENPTDIKKECELGGRYEAVNIAMGLAKYQWKNNYDQLTSTIKLSDSCEVNQSQLLAPNEVIEAFGDLELYCKAQGNLKKSKINLPMLAEDIQIKSQIIDLYIEDPATRVQELHYGLCLHEESLLDRQDRLARRDFAMAIVQVLGQWATAALLLGAPSAHDELTVLSFALAGSMIAILKILADSNNVDDVSGCKNPIKTAGIARRVQLMIADGIGAAFSIAFSAAVVSASPMFSVWIKKGNLAFKGNGVAHLTGGAVDTFLKKFGKVADNQAARKLFRVVDLNGEKVIQLKLPNPERFMQIFDDVAENLILPTRLQNFVDPLLGTIRKNYLELYYNAHKGNTKFVLDRLQANIARLQANTTKAAEASTDVMAQKLWKRIFKGSTQFNFSIIRRRSKLMATLYKGVLDGRITSEKAVYIALRNFLPPDERAEFGLQTISGIFQGVRDFRSRMRPSQAVLAKDKLDNDQIETVDKVNTATTDVINDLGLGVPEGNTLPQSNRPQFIGNENYFNQIKAFKRNAEKIQRERVSVPQ